MNLKTFTPFVMTRPILLTALALVLLAAHTALAHTVWIEPLQGQVVIRFAEPDGSFEKSPGHLDSLSPPTTIVLITNAPANVETVKKTNHFQVVGAAPGNIVCTESIFSVRGGRKPYFYARWQPAEAGSGTPLLTLDLVPTGKTGEVRLYFRGQPLAGIKATLRTPDEKEQEIVSDAEGKLHFQTTQSGLHLLTVAHHREPLAGYYRGQTYQQTSHNAALTWIQAQR